VFRYGRLLELDPEPQAYKPNVLPLSFSPVLKQNFLEIKGLIDVGLK
jgi:hypothetical protein